MKFSTSFLVLAVVMLVVAGCSMFSPGYDQRNAELTLQLQQAQAATDAAKAQTSAAQDKAAQALAAAATALKTGDAQKVAAAQIDATAASAQLAKAFQDFTDKASAEAKANVALMQNKVDSALDAAKNAGGILGGNGGLAAGALALLTAYFAKRESADTKAQVAVAAAGPSRAQPEVDDQWDEIAKLREQLAHVSGKVGVPLAPATAAIVPAAQAAA